MLQIFVFVDPDQTEKQANIIKVIDQYYNVFVDAVNGRDITLLKRKFDRSNHRFFFVSEFISMCTLEELECVSPDFAIVFQDGLEVGEKEWIMVERYLESLFFPSNQVSGEVILTAQKLLETRKKTVAHITPTESRVPPPKEFYNLNLKEVKERDIMLIQVDKPFCDLPYTVVIRNYSNNGLKSFFTDLFICQSWGVCRKDYVFLQQVWTHWEMDGEMDLDAMLLAATQRCFPQEGVEPSPEPEVYRRTIDEVLNGFDKREQGCQHDMKDPWNEQRLKKRRLEDTLLN